MIHTNYVFWQYDSTIYFNGKNTSDDDVIYHFDAISTMLQVPGTYYEYLPGVNSNVAGLYYVFGLNEEVIKKQDFFIPELIERKNTNKVLGDKVLLDINCVKIDFDNPMKTFEDFMTILKGMMAVQFFCRNICDLPYPDAMPENLLITLFKLHATFKCHENHPKAELRYLEDVCFMGGNLISFYMKSEKYSLVKKIFCREEFSHKLYLLTHNKTTVQKVKRTYCGDLTTLKVPTQVWNKFKKEVGAYPELFFYVVKKEQFDVNKCAFALKKSYRDLINCRYSDYIIKVPTPYVAKFSFILHNCVFEEYGTCQASEIITKGETFGAFYIPYYFYYDFCDMAKKNKIDFAMDKQYVLDSKPDCIPILVPYKDIKRVNNILNSYQCKDIERDYFNGVRTMKNTYYLVETEAGDNMPRIKNVPFMHLSVVSAPYSYSYESVSGRKKEFSREKVMRNKIYKETEKGLKLKSYERMK